MGDFVGRRPCIALAFNGLEQAKGASPPKVGGPGGRASATL
jgi:hypothetical protein